MLFRSGKTAAIRTAFMRRKLEDWEHAETLATPYTRERVERFSPRSKAILEIQSARDLEILEKIYANSVLLGDDGPDGWGIKYATEFHMTNDSKLFPPRPKWEAQGYRPDEYSRWLKGDWRPIGELWTELGVKPLPEGERRCAQPPYGTLPIPRADIPEGFILSREADAWVREERVEDVALPLYQGIMVQQFMPTARGWLSGTGLSARWNYNGFDAPLWNPQYLMARDTASSKVRTFATCKIGYREVARSTDTRSFIGSILPEFPCGHKVPILRIAKRSPVGALVATGLMNSLVFDWLVRERLGAAALAWYVLKESALPRVESASKFAGTVGRLNYIANVFAPLLVRLNPTKVDPAIARTEAERCRLTVQCDAVATALFGLNLQDLTSIMSTCDFPKEELARGSATKMVFDARGFWRIDKDKDPELRHTVLTLVAFHDLQQKIDAAGGDREAGIEAFCNQNDGEGWMLPETLRLADYGLGHDERAKEPQPVASRLGPRFYDWQLAQSPEESWRECHLHARNLLGEAGYRQLLADIEAEKQGEPLRRVAEATTRSEERRVGNECRSRWSPYH